MARAPVAERPAAGATFHVAQPTRIVAGRGVAASPGRWIASFGCRALVVTGEGHARASGLLAQVDADLRAEGLTTEHLEGVPPNPTVSIVDAGAQLARAWRADVVLAIGGGSVIDVGKAIATAAAQVDARPFREHLSGIRASGLHVSTALPLVALPTLPGSASETNGTSVITDDVTGRKLSANTDLACPRIALLDPLVAVHAPRPLLATGLADAACHAVEAMLSNASSIASDALAEQALRMLSRLGDAPLQQRDNGDDADSLLVAWWASNLAGQALTYAGSIVTHPLAHAVSARLDARHGAAVAALEWAVIVARSAHAAERGSLQRLARSFDVRGFDDPEVALRGVLTRLGRYLAALDVRESLADLGVTQQTASTLVRDARESGSRGLANTPGGEPTVEELFEVLDAAAATGPTSTAKRMLAARPESG